MACRALALPGGGTAMVCGRGMPAPKPCSVCRKHEGDKLCDGRALFHSGTCSRPLCSCCATTRPNPKKTGATVDFCPHHSGQAPAEQLELGGRRG